MDDSINGMPNTSHNVSITQLHDKNLANPYELPGVVSFLTKEFTTMEIWS